MIDVISVHVAKCAGSSFDQALRRAYGDEAIYHDYGDAIADPRSPMNVDPEQFFAGAAASGYPWAAGKRVIHGHFHLRKYDAYPAPCRRITFLRHPVDHTISLYFFWRHMPRAGHTLQDYLLDNDLSLLDFAQLPYIRSLYREVYFAGLERRAFDFVGAVERLDADLATLSALLGRRLEMPHVNASPRADAPEWRDPSVRRELAAIRKDDVALYEEWCGR